METIKHNGKLYQVEIAPDYDHGAPWDEEDGHGPVTGWESRSKAPGELVLSTDRGKSRFYDFAEAVRIARQDGWGFAAGRVQTSRNAHHGKRKFRATFTGRADLEGFGPDINAAISDLYRAHKATFPTARAYHAAAARADYEYLRRWCADQWWYVGVVVREVRNGSPVGPSESLWGIESEDSDYIAQVARDLAAQLT